MQFHALQFIACPICGSRLNSEGKKESSNEIHEGWLICQAGCGRFPITGGVPRLLPELRGASTHEAGTQDHNDIQTHANRSFGNEWRMYRYGDTTWGVTVAERIRVVLYELGWTEEELEGKVILDAGCGNGTLSAALCEKGAEVVAVDLSDSVIKAHEQFHNPRLHFVQGNLFFPPLRTQQFDAIYSAGVFHHTPDTQRCFNALVPTLKRNDEARYFVWLYARRSILFNSTVEHLMKITRRMPGWMLCSLCYAARLPVEGASRLLILLGILDAVPRSLNDRALYLYDLLSPKYVHYHTFEEARQWREAAGLRRVEAKDYRLAREHEPDEGAILGKYRRLIRPGFGILARYPSEAQDEISNRFDLHRHCNE